MIRDSESRRNKNAAYKIKTRYGAEEIIYLLLPIMYRIIWENNNQIYIINSILTMALNYKFIQLFTQ